MIYRKCDVLSKYAQSTKMKYKKKDKDALWNVHDGC